MPEITSLQGATAESVFANLLLRGNGGVHVRSTAAPALSTQFVKSHETVRASAFNPGAFAEVSYPTHEVVQQKTKAKHEREDLFGYTATIRSDAYPAGYGERASQAVAREEGTFQLKGTFPAASLAFAKLRARVEARDGDVESLDSIFATMWGIPKSSVEMMPKMHLSGNEVTRSAALEDRAYHSLSGHPAVSGGYRVDTATLAPDSLGSSVPLNWPRIRTALKAIALVQIQGDLQCYQQIMACLERQSFEVFFNMVVDSQPRHIRPYPWELIMAAILNETCPQSSEALPDEILKEAGIASGYTQSDSFAMHIISHPEHQMLSVVSAVAHTVALESNKAFKKTIDVILEYDRARVEQMELDEDGLTELERSEISVAIEVPMYKVYRGSLYKGVASEYRNIDTLPDVQSQSRPRSLLDLQELREAKLVLPIDVQGALHLAVYLNTMKAEIRPHAYHLMAVMGVLTRSDTDKRPASERLRVQEIYNDPEIRALGPVLFGRSFVGSLEMLLRNMTIGSHFPDVALKQELWRYLSGRTHPRRACPVAGGWRDMIEYLLHAPEGWSLFYWTRMTLGKQHHAVSSGILAPMSAGREMDALMMCKLGVRERIARWKEYYSAKYKVIEASIAKEKVARAQRSTEPKHSSKYIPPHLRRAIDLEHTYDADEILARKGGYEAEQYQDMVEMQTKAKFFAGIEVYTIDRRLLIGVSDSRMYEILIEFYQARWYSLEKRISRAREQGVPFRLGPWTFTEHPWGELVTDLPSTVEEVLYFMSSLNQSAWTLPPRYLYDKLQKSIRELWEDIHQEVNALQMYVSEVHSGLAQEQEDTVELRNERTVKMALAGIKAIEIPSTGYVPPYQRPVRSIAVQTSEGDGWEQRTTSATTFLAVHEPEDDDMGTLEDVDDDDVGHFGVAQSLMHDYVVEEKKCMTYRHIWHTLGLEDADEQTMRFAMGLSGDLTMDSVHTDVTFGPFFVVGEEVQMIRAWQTWKSRILQKLKIKMPEREPDDLM